MSTQTHLSIAAIVIALFAVPVGVGAGLVPVGPIVNGGFELAPPDGVGDALAGTPADTCVGIGHQVYYGSDTLQADVLDRGDAEGAAARVAADPAGEAAFAAGVGHCVSSNAKGHDLVWVVPADRFDATALGWSFDANARTAYWGDHDGDEDREVLIPVGAGGHNMWQAYAHPQQAWSGSFDALTFRVEAGQVPSTASVMILLSATPLERADATPVVGLDCQITFRGAIIAPDADGLVSASPLDAAFGSRNAFCADLRAQWNAGDDDAKRDVLGKTRIVQLSFWNFDAGAGPVVLDDVEIVGGTTVAEEAAAGNANAPQP